MNPLKSFTKTLIKAHDNKDEEFVLELLNRTANGFLLKYKNFDPKGDDDYQKALTIIDHYKQRGLVS